MTTENLPAATAMKSSATGSSDAEARANLFPQYLMKLLNDDVAPEALWWLPDGKAFAIDPKKIDGQVLDKYFQKTKYSSFIRRLHNEGYRRQTRKYKKVDGLTLPEGTVVLSHDSFQREHPEMLDNFYNKKTTAPPKALLQAKVAAASAVSTSPRDSPVLASLLPAASTTAVRETQAAALLGLSQAHLRPSAMDSISQGSLLAASSSFGTAAAAGLPPNTLSKSIAALRQARRQREQEESLRTMILLQQAQKTQQSGLFSNERSGSPPAEGARTLLDSQVQLQQLRFETSRRQLEEQSMRLDAMEALRRAAYSQWP
ncbi:HSF-type DNA-binding [Seminavis robusta]|uniref:HSF-type DNA-binding n=1 Tax=Seminavis robusta TaxID=568900 RepID=A0A9N8H9K1_9STRA|nr:HSF-type DNA-binding [Seminavis robusta]|eukprot:Sro279_g106820.1 HSF-type DNA-binding (316) ;mRNA; r:41688-42635